MAGVAVVLGLAGASCGDDLEKQLLKQAPEIIRTYGPRAFRTLAC